MFGVRDGRVPRSTASETVEGPHPRQLISAMMFGHDGTAPRAGSASSSSSTAGHLLLHRGRRAGDDDSRPALERIAGAVQPPGEPDTTRWEHRGGDRHVEHRRTGNVFVLTGLRILSPALTVQDLLR